MRASLRTILFVGPLAVSDPPNPEVTTWVNLVATNGGAVSSGTRRAADAFMNDLTTAGLRTKIVYLNLRAGSNLAACRTPIIRDFGNTIETNSNFVEADYSEANGLYAGAGNTNKQLNTGVSPSTAGLSNIGASLGMVVANSTADGNKFALGCTDGTNNFGLRPRFSSLIIGDIFASGNGRIQKANTDSLGFIVASRISTTDGRDYKNGTQVGTTTATSGGVPPNLAVLIFADQNGNRGDYISRGDFIGLGLNVSDVMNLHNTFQTFNAALGRAI